MYGLEAVIPIESEIPYLKLVVEILAHTTSEEERFLYLDKLEKSHCDVVLANKSHKNHIKS